MSRLIQRQVWVKTSPIHGRGVFAGEAFSPGEIIEECHTLHVGPEIKSLSNYVFKCKGAPVMLPLGAGAIYNHADEPNAKFKMDLDRQVLVVQACRAIACGDEIFISYGKGWFDSRHVQPMQRSMVYRIKRWIRRSTVPRGALATMTLILLSGMGAHFFG